MNLKFLQIGLGSMGKRRIRNLQYLGYQDIIAYDVRQDRRNEAESLYAIQTMDTFDDVLWDEISHVIVSTPPDQHAKYAIAALNRGKHVFIEASVVDDGYVELKQAAAQVETVLAPSCTMRFDPLNMKLKKWLSDMRIGKLLFAQHHFGLYLPKWHPYESIHDFYVSKRQTGAAREIVPFDLVYLSWLLGAPTSISCVREMTGTLDADIDDIYALTYQSDQCRVVQMAVDVVSQVPYRTTRIVGDKGNIELDTVKGTLSLYETDTALWEHLSRPGLAVTKSTEEMYVLEMECFIQATLGEAVYPYSIEEDEQVLGFLYAAERSDKSGTVEVVL